MAGDNDRSDRGEDRPKRAAATGPSAAELTAGRITGIDRQIAAAQSATTAFEQQQRAFESQIAALGKPSDPSQFGQLAPDLSFTPGDFGGPAYNRTPPPGVGITNAIEQSSRFGSPTAAFTLSNIQSRFGGDSRGVPRGVPKKTTTRQGGVTTTAPEGTVSPVQRVLGDRQKTRLGGQGKF